MEAAQPMQTGAGPAEAAPGSPFDILSELEVWHIMSQVDEAADLLRCSHVSAEWRAQADDEEDVGVGPASSGRGRGRFVGRASAR